MGHYLKICEGTFYLKMTDFNAIFGLTLPILMLDQFSDVERCALSWANLAHQISLLASVDVVVKCEDWTKVRNLNCVQRSGQK